MPWNERASAEDCKRESPLWDKKPDRAGIRFLRNYLFEITKSTVSVPLALTVTDFSQLLGWENTGR